MKRRALYRWTTWLLPLLLVRAFVPVGFMLAANESGLSLVLCSATIATEAASSADAHSDHHHEHAAGHQGQDAAVTDGAESTALCPFAVSGSGCTHALSHIAGVTPSSKYSPPSESLLLPAVGPTRSDRIRAPPAFA